MSSLVTPPAGAVYGGYFCVMPQLVRNGWSVAMLVIESQSIPARTAHQGLSSTNPAAGATPDGSRATAIAGQVLDCHAAPIAALADDKDRFAGRQIARYEDTRGRENEPSLSRTQHRCIRRKRRRTCDASSIPDSSIARLVTCGTQRPDGLRSPVGVMTNRRVAGLPLQSRDAVMSGTPSSTPKLTCSAVRARVRRHRRR